jgi:hypothetical protein
VVTVASVAKEEREATEVLVVKEAIAKRNKQ